MASTQALPSDVHATTVEQVEKDKEDIPLSKEDGKKTVIEETPEVPEVVATTTTTTADDKQPESVIGTEDEKEVPVVDAPAEVDSKEVDISAPKTEQEPEPVSIKEEEKPVIEVKEKEVATEVHEVAKSEAVAEATEDKAEKATSEVVAPELVIEETNENVEAVVKHEEKPIAEVVEDVPAVKPEEKPAAEAVQDPEPEIKNHTELVTQEPVTVEGHVEAAVEHEEKPIPEVVEEVLAVEAEEKPATEAVQDSEPEIKNLSEQLTPEPVTIEGHVEAVIEQEKPTAEVVEDVPAEKNEAEAKEESTMVTKLAEQVPQEPVAIEGHVVAVVGQEEKPTSELVEDAPSEKNGAEVKEEPTTVTKLVEQVTQVVDEVKPEAPTEEEAKNGDDGIVTSSRDMATEEVVVKTKQSSNIMSKVKQSLVKVKKAIIGKSPSSKALSAETKVEVKAK